MNKLTPYDTGAVLQPFPWLGEGAYIDDESDDPWGKVDFDNEEGATICTVSTRRDPVTGEYLLTVGDHRTGTVTVVAVGVPNG